MTTDCQSQDETTCRHEFREIHRKLDRRDEAIRGNGKPGLQVRLDRLEQDARRQGRLIWLLLGAVGTGIATAVTMLIVG